VWLSVWSEVQIACNMMQYIADAIASPNPIISCLI